MDLERMLHTKHQTSIVIATALSIAIVMAFTLLGRGALNFKGALVLEEPTDVTVIAALEPKLDESATITRIEFLRDEPSPNRESEKRAYSYLVTLSTDETFLTRIDWNKQKRNWELITFERLHVDR